MLTLILTLTLTLTGMHVDSNESMGINQLLSTLRDISEDSHISKYNGQVAGVDGHCW